MVTKLGRPAADQGGSGSGGGAPAGWGSGSNRETAASEAPRGRGGDQPQNERSAPAGWGATTQDEHADQRERIRDRIAPQEDRAGAAASAFTGGVGDSMTRVAGEYDDPAGQGGAPAGWGGGTKAAPFEPDSRQEVQEPADKPARRSRAKAPAADVGADLIAARAQVLSAVIAATPDADITELVEITRELMAFVEQG